tara:strand:+ start:159 stop:1100 length:942 start_codon:yes stop_codon:yes gene_type:complete
MAITSSGPLNLSGIQTEFGGSNPISLSEYYSGGLYVPPGAYGINGLLPTSGAISLNKFYGSQAALDQTQSIAAIYNSFGSFYKNMGNRNNADYRWETGVVEKTYNFSFPENEYPQGSRWTTIVAVAGVWNVNNSIVYSVNGIPITAPVNGGAANATNLGSISVYRIEMDFRDVTSVVVKGNKTTSDTTFLLSCGVFPGDWKVLTDQNGFSLPGNSFSTTIAAKSIDLYVGSNWYLDNSPWPSMSLPSGGSGYTYIAGSGWWYSAFADLAVVNGSASSTSYSTSWSVEGNGFTPLRAQLTWSPTVASAYQTITG